MRTTTALTIINGGVEDNTIPAEAKAIVNFRLLPGDTIADVLWHAKKVIKDERVKFKPVEGKFNEALPVSPRDGPAYKGLQNVVRQVFDNPPVAPFVMLGGTDCQHFVPVCDDIYRFTSVVMDESFMGLEHGIDERIPVEAMGKMVKFYAQLMQVWGTKEMMNSQGKEQIMRIVVALGGNALLKRGEPMTHDVQRANIQVAAQALAPVAQKHQLVLAHGNGPQVGLLALQASAYKDVEAYPLDVLGAQTEGMIGYMIEQELGNLLPFEVPFATILTMVEVDPARPGLPEPDQVCRSGV